MAEAKAAAERVDVLKESAQWLKSLTGPAVVASDSLSIAMIERLGFKASDLRVAENGHARPKELEEGALQGSTREESMLRTVAYLQARKAGLSVQDAKNQAMGADVMKPLYDLLEDVGTTKRPEFEETERPRNWKGQTNKVMTKIKEDFGLEKADIAHQLSYDTIMKKVAKFVQEGDAVGLQKFVENFVGIPNSVLEELDPTENPKLQAVHQQYKQVLQEQTEDIVHKLTGVLEADVLFAWIVVVKM